VTTSTENLLPEGFGDLEKFVGYWAVKGINERRFQRCNAHFNDIKQFYNSMYEKADEAMNYLSQFDLSDMPEKEERLLQLVLALVQASMAVEIHNESRVPMSPWPDTIRISSAISL